MSDDRPFRSVSHALRVGYEAECHLSYQPVSAFSQYRPQEGGVRLPPDPYWQGATASDRAAEAGKVVGLVRRTLSGATLFAVEAYYLPNDDAEPRVVFLKQYACASLIPFVREGMKSPPIDGFLADAVRAWAKIAECENKMWGEKLGVHPSTVWRWRAGSKTSRGVNTILNDWLDDARAMLGNPMRDYGLIP